MINSVLLSLSRFISSATQRSIEREKIKLKRKIKIKIVYENMRYMPKFGNFPHIFLSLFNNQSWPSIILG